MMHEVRLGGRGLLCPHPRGCKAARSTGQVHLGDLGKHDRDRRRSWLGLGLGLGLALALGLR